MGGKEVAATHTAHRAGGVLPCSKPHHVLTVVNPSRQAQHFAGTVARAGKRPRRAIQHSGLQRPRRVTRRR